MNNTNSFQTSENIEKLRSKFLDPEKLKEQKALLVGIYQGADQKKGCLQYLDELKELASTFGIIQTESLPCPLKKKDAATLLHKGKLEEINELIQTLEFQLVIFDEEISPAQQRNLEKIFKIPVIDRTELVIEIFAQRAQTKEARLQIDLAKTKYELPRLKRLWSHLSRQSSGGLYLKGEGEKQIEIDRRLLKAKIEVLQNELKEVKQYRQTQRNLRKRSGIPTFAIIGYTNAGKSTLLNALTKADVFVEDKLFATLDPTTRKFKLPNNQDILLTDTVGFIRKLPHTLIAAFKSTLEEALDGDILLHVIDVSHPQALDHAEATHQILKELGAQHQSIITVLNKIDLCTDRKMVDQLRIKYPKIVTISATNRQGFEELMDLMIQEISRLRKLVKLAIPQSQFSLVTELQREAQILGIDYEEDNVVILAQIPEKLIHRYSAFFLKD